MNDQPSLLYSCVPCSYEYSYVLLTYIPVRMPGAPFAETRNTCTIVVTPERHLQLYDDGHSERFWALTGDA